MAAEGRVVERGVAGIVFNGQAFVGQGGGRQLAEAAELGGEVEGRVASGITRGEARDGEIGGGQFRERAIANGGVQVGSIHRR
jgi:hypothetical protein